MTRPPLHPLLVAVVLVTAACSPSPLPDGERRQVLAAVASDVALATLAQVSVRTGELDVAARSFVSAPSPEGLQLVRARFWSAREPWKESTAFAFGPAEELMSEAAIDQWPVDPARIEAVLAGAEPLDAAGVALLGANRKGFHSLEYLLFRDPEGTTALAALSAPDAAGIRRRDYLVGLSGALFASVRALEQAWQPAGGDYASRFAKPGSDEAAFATTQDALDVVVNQCVELADTLANARLAKPLGLNTGGVPDPSLEESPWADASVDDIRASLRGIRSVYEGTRVGAAGAGLGRLVHASSPSADARIRSALSLAEQRVEAIPRPYADALTDTPDVVQVAYEAVRDLKRILATEIVSLLGATLKFNDNDGD